MTFPQPRTFALAVAASATAILSVPVTHAATLFDFDTNVANFSLSHTSATSSDAPPQSGSISVGNGTFSWGNLVTDGTANTANNTANGFFASDWGGTGTYTSAPIDLTGQATIDITGTYSGSFNSSSEFSNFFYTLDGSSTDFGIGIKDANANDVTTTIEDLDVTGFSTLTVGFTFSHDGASDSFQVSELTVDAPPIPEPATLALGTLGAAVLFRRKLRDPDAN
jgi:hypothetical protein